MTEQKLQVLNGVVVGTEISLTIDELGQACGAQSEWVVELVDEGILDVPGTGPDDWQFGGRSLRRARLARRLQQDLDINLAGVALVLDLMEEIDRLHAQLLEYR